MTTSLSCGLRVKEVPTFKNTLPPSSGLKLRHPLIILNQSHNLENQNINL
ncbi:hypothetical protein B7P43_G17917 [Cryptotermes secundus]|uniref:Uncharacterized protein n=1 Tax=Cryptotermes secundus TaxID=105785 RepID=A0A2J7R020_9NEOP|nr:hypothetical protein B7P43_G17917 [Cryptotermes secundus]